MTRGRLDNGVCAGKCSPGRFGASPGEPDLRFHAGLRVPRQVRKAHTGFEPVLPENAEDKPNSGSGGQIAPGSELNPHLRLVLERLKERDQERRR
jgi:hypothetical protein